MKHLLMIKGKKDVSKSPFKNGVKLAACPLFEMLAKIFDII